MNDTLGTLAVSPPDWQLSFNDFNLAKKEFVVTPTQKFHYKANGGARLLVYRDSLGKLTGVYIYYFADDSYFQKAKGKISILDFTGFIVYTDLQGHTIIATKVENGEATSKAKVSGGSFSFRDITCTTYPCSDGIAAVNCEGTTICSGTFGGGSVPTNSFPSFPWLNSNNGNNGGGGSSSPLSNNWSNNQPNNLFNTDAQLQSILGTYAYNIVSDNVSAKNTIRAFLVKFGASQISAILNNIDVVDINTDLFNQNLNLMISNNNFYLFSKNAGFPKVGTDDWINALQANFPGDKLNAKEIELGKQFPFELFQVYTTKVSAVFDTKFYYPSYIAYSGPDNDRNLPNSFQHADWNAQMVFVIGKDRANVWGTAHEQQTAPGVYDMASQMDLWNNDQGRKAAVEAGNISDAKDLIFSKITNNEMRIVKFD